MHPIHCRCAICLVDRSSFGTPEAKAARESVTDEEVAGVIRRAKEIEARDARHREEMAQAWDEGKWATYSAEREGRDGSELVNPYRRRPGVTGEATP